MTDSTKNISPPILIDLPAAYSQGGFVQSRSVFLQTEVITSRTDDNSVPRAANDTDPPIDPAPAA
ncbi:MAG: hypothetical protein K2Q28_11295 [Hyphomicrobium sp.]|nr:hypothetical protein [Hyphomicrobium sp.]